MKLIRLQDVMVKLGIRRNTVYRLINSGNLPKPIKIGKASLWLEDDINEAIKRFVDNKVIKLQ